MVVSRWENIVCKMDGGVNYEIGILIFTVEKDKFITKNLNKKGEYYGIY